MSLEQVDRIAQDVANEVRRAVQIHAPIHSLHEAKAVIEEEFEEFWDLVKVNPKKLSADDQERRIATMRNELIQTAAMCVRAVHDLFGEPQS